MKVDFNIVLNDLRGDPLKDGDNHITLGTITAVAMVQVAKGDDALDGNKKVDMFRLAQKATDGGVQDVTAEQIALLKQRVGQMYGALIVGRVYDALESGKVVSLVKE